MTIPETPTTRLVGKFVSIGTFCSMTLFVTFFVAFAFGVAEEYQGPVAVSVSQDARTLFVANSDARQVAFVQLPEGNVLRRIDMPAQPTGLVLSPDGSRLFVTCAAPQSQVVVLDTLSGQIRATICVGHTARSPVIAPDGKTLYVCNRFDNDISVLDLTTGKEHARVQAVREPITADITPDGKTLLVANHLPNLRTDVFSTSLVTTMITVVDTQTLQTSQIPLASGSMGIRDLCISPDGKWAYVTHVLCNFELIPMQVDMGWTNTNVLSVLDLEKQDVFKTIGLDAMTLAAGNPWGVDTSADGALICISHAGTHEISLLDASVLSTDLYQLFTSPLVVALPDSSPPAPKERRRIRLPGKGPRELTVSGSNVYLAEYFSDSVAVVELDSDENDAPKAIALGPKPILSERRRGELLFNDATICYQQWQSCASCHPDGRSDALNWDLLNDGAGNFKNTKSLVLVDRTPPMMAEGIRTSSEAAVRAGIEHILFTTRPDEDVEAINAYLQSLEPVSSPHLLDGHLTPAAERGKKLFESDPIGCHQCHPEPLYTDQRMHNVGSKSPYGYSDRFDTPTLIEAWRTAPYLHNGRYLTIEALLGEGKHGNTRGRIDKLTPEEIHDLAQFVLSL